MQQVKIETPIKRVGVIVDVSSEVVCHNYVGITIFNNKTHQVPLEEPFLDAVKSSIIDTLAKSGKDTIEIAYEEISTGGEFLSPQSVNGRYEVLEPAIENYKNIVDKHNLDAVIAYVNHPSTDEEKCAGVFNVDGGLYGLYASGGTAVLLTTNGEYSDRYALYGKVSGSPIARQPKQLSKSHVHQSIVVMLNSLKEQLTKQLM